MHGAPYPHSPTSFADLESSTLGRVDLLGRNKFLQGKTKRADAGSEFAKIERNAFKFKSLSCWSYNISVGCRHGCRFCYVPSAQQTGRGKIRENTSPLSLALRQFGVDDADSEWGDYVLFRPWDETTFLNSLRRAENTPLQKLNPDGNRAIILCSTTDPYQTVAVSGDPPKQKLLNHHARFLVRKALELILEHSTLNVRILTRSPLAREDFDLFKKFGDRLLFGMSIPTLNERLLKIYEPHAPSAAQRIATLEKAATAGIPLYAAVAPTYPECDEGDLRATLKAIRPLNPLTVFHEPINIRAENVERIATHAARLKPPVTLRTEVFDTPETWRRYAVEQLMAMQKVATELGMEDHLHLWPDKKLRSEGAFMKARTDEFKRATTGRRVTAHETLGRREADQAAFQEFLHWLAHWHSRISEWPGE